MNKQNGTPTRRAGGAGFKGGRGLAALLLAASVLGAGFQAQANPQGGHVVAGSGNITNPNKNLTVIHQNSSGLIINWNSFNIGNGQTVRFIQPNASSSALNRIFSQNPTDIFGNLLSNGQVYLVNANGIYFGRNSYVNTGALFASTLDISDRDFMNGDLNFSAPAGQDGGAIVNHGTLIAADGGSINLIGGSVYNDGVIQATLGQVDLVAGHAVTVDFDGDGLMSFEVTAPVLHKMLDAQSGDAVDNEGTIKAGGGSVLMTASVAKDVFAAAVNNGGVVQANGVQVREGGVYLTGSDFGGSSVAAGTQSEPTDSPVSEVTGSISMTGQGGDVVNSGTLDASSHVGDGGTVLLQSTNSTILEGSSSITAESLSAGVGGSV